MSSCGSCTTSNCGCSKGSLEDKILVPKPPRNCVRCARCGTPVDGPYCQGCALLRKEFKEDLFTYGVEMELFNHTKEERKSVYAKSKRPKSVMKIPICDDDDKDNTTAITPVLPIEEPDNSLSMGDEHLDTIPATESDEVIKSSVENLIPIPSESEGIPDKMCDVPLCENTTPLNALNEHSEIVVDSNDDNSSSDDDYPYGEDIDYVDASPPDVEIVSLKVVGIVDPEVGRIDDDILLTIKDDILHESSSGSPTTHSELSLPDYKAFYVDNDHLREEQWQYIIMDFPNVKTPRA
ncbi:hypothetical protein Tco_0184172 [Tanacetum coccineum]